MKTIFFDLDGTLLNSKERLYQLFNDLTNNTILSFDEYWKLKKTMHSNQWILENHFHLTNLEINSFTKEWMLKIEDDKYLDFDFVFDDVVPTLKSLNKFNLYIVTARQFKDKTINQLNNLGISQFFKDVLVTENKSSKSNLIRMKEIDLSNKCFLVGDTGEDVKTAKELGLFSIAILTGFRNKSILEKYNPDFIVENLKEINSIVND